MMAMPPPLEKNQHLQQKKRTFMLGVLFPSSHHTNNAKRKLEELVLNRPLPLSGAAAVALARLWLQTIPLRVLQPRQKFSCLSSFWYSELMSFSFSRLHSRGQCLAIYLFELFQCDFLRLSGRVGMIRFGMSKSFTT